MLFIKIIVILSAFTALSTRLFAYENVESLDAATAAMLNHVGIAAAVICLISGIALGLLYRKKQKTNPDEKKEDNENEENS